MWRKLFRPYPAIVTAFVFAVIGILSLISLNLHFLDPFRHGVKDYDITDIVYSRFHNGKTQIDERIVIVNTGRPDRATVTALLERITAAQPKAVGVDVLFSDRKDPETDSLLQAVLKKSDNIVLASVLKNYREDLGRFEREAEVDTFFQNYARTGFANFPSLETKTIRFFTPKEMTAAGPVYSFATEITRRVDAAAVQRLLRRKNNLERIHFSSKGDHFIQFEASNILDTTIDLRPLLGDKIVLLGYNDAYNEECPLLDKFYTPLNQRYTGRSEPDMYGIIIHANIIRMLLDHKYIFSVPGWLSFLFAILYCYANVILLEWVHNRYPRMYHPIIRILQVLEFTLLFFLIALLFYAFRIKWDFTTGMLALALYFDVLLSYEGLSGSHRPWINRLPRILRRNL
jgi:CHASE2 domain-containing sensor protein